MKEIEIIYEDDHIIVCHKPAGMATQTKRLGQQDMETYLKNYRASKKEQPYIGIVHRLDQPVEGLMVFAKSQKAAAELSRQVQKRQIGKHYYALCNQEEGTVLASCLENYMVTDKKANVSRIVDKTTPGAKLASLEYVPKQKGDKVLMDITLHTGRQHQIRLQLSNIGCPIVGDSKYGKGSDPTGLKLCSYRLEFVHPITKENMDFSIEPSWL